MSEKERDDTERMKKIFAKQREEEAAHLAAVKEEAARIGKEPFDIDRLLEFVTDYNIQKGMDNPELRETARREYESQYYSYKKAMTLKEFAEFLDRAAMYD